VAQLQLLLFSGLAFFVMLGLLRRTLTITLDTDWVYRRLGPVVARALGWAIPAVDGAMRASSLSLLTGLGAAFARAARPGGVLGRPRETRVMVLWVAVLLVAYLVAYYI
jgi:multicomponent Na+:H+ antiporter subunit D